MRLGARYVILMFALAAACQRQQYSAQLNDGDQVELVSAPRGHELVVRKGGELGRIRLVGIYAFPATTLEKRGVRNYAKSAIAMVQALAGAQALRVELERKEPDPRGRFLGFVRVGDVDLGRHLIEKGEAAIYTEYPFSREADYFAAEAPARAGAVGLWSNNAAAERVRSLRRTWAAVREREHKRPVRDPLLEPPS